MKNTLFSVKLYLQGLKKVRAVGIAAAICVIVLNAILPVISFIENSMAWLDMRENEIIEIDYYLFSPFGLLVIIFAPLMIYSMFSFLNERNKSDFYHALPQTRGCVYISFMAAVITWIFSILAASAIVNAVLWLLVPYYHLSFITVIITLINYFILALFMIGFMILAMTLTGTVTSNFLIFILVTLFVRVVGAIFVYSVSEVTTVFLLSHSWMKILDFNFFMPWNLILSIFGNTGNAAFTNVWLMLYTFAVSLVLIAVSGILYKKRRSEIAGQSAPNAKMQTIYRCAVTFPFVLLMAYLFIVEGLESYQVVLGVITLLVYSLFELITTKKVKNMVKALPMIIVPFICGIIFISGVFITKNAIEGVQPTADEISTVSIISESSGSYEKHQTASIAIENDRANKIISDSLRQTIHYGTKQWHSEVIRVVNIRMELDNGRSIARRMYIADEDYTELQTYFYESEEYKKALLKLPEENEISNIYVKYNYISELDSEKLWESFSEEYNELSDDQKLFIKQQAVYNGAVDYPTMQVNGYIGLSYFYSNYPIIYEYMPKTAILFAQCSNQAQGYDTADKGIKEYYNFIKDFEISDQITYCDFSITLEEYFGEYNSHRYTFVPSRNEVVDGILLTAHKDFVKALCEFSGLSDYTDPEKKLYNISLGANYNVSEKTEQTDDVTYYESYYYKSFDFIVTLTDEEYQILLNTAK